MARFNSSQISTTISGATTVGSPYNGAFTELTGTAPYTVTLASPALFPGVNQQFYNATSGTVTLSTPSGNFVGTGGSAATTVPVYAGNVVSITADGTNYIVISEDGSALVATSATISGVLTVQSTGGVAIAPSTTGAIDNVAIGATTKASGAFNTLTANNAVTFTANTTSSSTGTGTVVITGGLGVSGTINAASVSASLTGTIQTAAQPNITSTGSLTIPGLTVDTNTIYVDPTNHRLGVGLTSPAVKLHADIATSMSSSSSVVDILALSDQDGQNNGVIGARIGLTISAQSNLADRRIGIYATASGSANFNTPDITFWASAQGVAYREIVRFAAANGNIGIGTNNPTNKLTVNNNASTLTITNPSTEASLYLIGGDAAANRLWMQSYGGNNWLNAIAYGGTAAAPSATTADLGLLVASVGGYGASTAIGAGQGRFGLYAETTWTNSTSPTYFIVQTGTAGGVERLRITSTGNVGVGTNAPAYKLHVAGTSGIDDPRLTAISTTVSTTATKIFVYDTTKDSDGGAWRKRTQHASWYNETLNTATRGSRQEFPSVAIIATSSTGVTIYDGDDPTMPMWMVFNCTVTNTNILGWFTSGVATMNSVYMLNATLVVGTNGGFVEFNFIKDRSKIAYSVNSWFMSSMPSIALRNTYPTLVSEGASGTNGYIILNTATYEVAMTVLPNAQIDPQTQLPIPTIVVANEGGVNVIKNGIVYYITTSNWSNSTGCKISGTTLYAQQGLYYWYAVDLNSINSNFAALADRYATAPFRNVVPFAQYQYLFNGLGAVGSPDKYDFVNFTSNSYPANVNNYLNLTSTNVLNPNYGMCASISNTFNTGWVHGTPVGTWLSDTTAETITNTELVSNGTFTSNVTGWTLTSTMVGGTSTLTSVSGQARLFIAANGSSYWCWTPVSVVAGKTYVFKCDIISATSAAYVRIGYGTEGGNYELLNISNGTTAGTITRTVIATTTGTAYINFGETAGNNTLVFDNVSLRLAEPDRSLSNNGLQIYGSVTKSVVNTGNDLVGYGGWSASNYLYISTIPFTLNNSYQGHIGFWANPVSYVGALAVGCGFNGIYDSASSIFGATLGWTAQWAERGSNVGSAAANANSMIPGSWQKVDIVSNYGTTSVYVNGILRETGAFTYSISNPTFWIGAGNSAGNGGAGAFYGSIALARLTQTAPSAAQITKMYNDEKVLFQPGAKSAIYGGSSTVTAIAYDDDTNLLHVGTSAGRSVFNGLRRISNTTTAVSNSIGAVNGLVAEN